jgi:hypothetical protein
MKKDSRETTARLAHNKSQRIKNLKLKVEVFSAICGAETPFCMCVGCRLNFLGFLQVDHENADGNKHTVGTTGRRMHGPQLWRWIKRNNYPKGFQILCSNCNGLGGKSSGDRCPLSGCIH